MGFKINVKSYPFYKSRVAQASPKHLPPASAPPVTQPAIASALPAAQAR